jgi:hypothetical protein
MSSPVLVAGHVYMHLGNGRLDCIDIATGESRWRSESTGKYGSMSYQGDKIPALDDQGTLHLIRANPGRFELLDSRSVSDQETWGHIAVSADQVFVRELEGVAVFRWNGASESAPSRSFTDSSVSSGPATDSPAE